MSDQAREAREAAFLDRVDALTLEAVRTGSGQFADLLRRLPSVYPTEVLSALDRLARSGRIMSGTSERLRQEAKRGVTHLFSERTLLPLPHPLDYEWRFTQDASRSLLNLAADLTPPRGDVLLFGTPGMAVEALALPIDRRLTLLAEDNVVTGRLVALNQAVGSPLTINLCSDGLPRANADAVVLDPPWYVDFIRPMLRAAAVACRPGGVLLLSMPPVTTRPSAEADQLATLSFARGLGLELLDHHPVSISYDTPFFEANALAVAGIHLESGWRRGDLFLFRKADVGFHSTLTSSSRGGGWTEVMIGRMRLFVRDTPSSGSPDLVPLADRGVLPTVSRRDRRRRVANVWTSGNRVFRTSNPALVLKAARSLGAATVASGARPRPCATMEEAEVLPSVRQALCDLAMVEEREERRLMGAAAGRSTPWMLSSTMSRAKSRAMASG